MQRGAPGDLEAGAVEHDQVDRAGQVGGDLERIDIVPAEVHSHVDVGARGRPPLGLAADEVREPGPGGPQRRHRLGEHLIEVHAAILARVTRPHAPPGTVSRVARSRLGTQRRYGARVFAAERVARRVYAAESRALAATDPRFGPLVERFGPVVLEGPTAPARRFDALCEAIAYQQLHATAAAAIWRRVRGAAGGPLTPARVERLGEEGLRATGLSGAKARAMLDLAARVRDGEVPLRRLGRLDDEAVVRVLTRVWGIGRWTAHMVLIFDLHRLDVWPVDDYGVRVAWARLTGAGDVPDPRRLALEGQTLAPWRSLAAWYCWRLVDG